MVPHKLRDFFLVAIPIAGQDISVFPGLAPLRLGG